MDVLEQQIRRATRCLIRNQVVTSCTWTLLAGLLIVAMAMLVAKWWPLEVDTWAWAVGWWVAGSAGGLAAGCTWAWLRRPTPLEAALEIDRRFGLHERISSAVTQPPAERASEVGQALVRDAVRSVDGLEVGVAMRPDWSWRNSLPLMAALVALVATLLPLRSGHAPAAEGGSTRQQVCASLQEFQRRLARREEALSSDAEVLQEAKDLLIKFENAAADLMLSDTEREDALVRLNHLSKDLAERRQGWEASQKIRDQLRQAHGPQPGPAEAVSRALQAGDLARAAHELRSWGELLDQEGLAAAQREQIADQLEALARSLERALDPHPELDESAPELSQDGGASHQDGDRAVVSRARQQREQQRRRAHRPEGQSPALKSLQELADQLREGADAAGEGQAGQAAEQVRDVAEKLQRIERESASAELADALARELSAAKNAMHCDQCGGQGCSACQGSEAAVGAVGATASVGDQPGPGYGGGRGPDYQAETTSEMGGFQTQVTADLRPGPAVRTGDVGGPNLPGTSHESIKQEIAGEFSAPPEPLVQQQLPRQERAQLKEYFELLRTSR